VEQFDRTVVVLNTTAFLGGLYSFMSENKMNWMYLDTDATGKNKIGEMEVYGIPFRDCSYLYEGHKDFNDLIKAGE
jgi:hypothetical protein